MPRGDAASHGRPRPAYSQRRQRETVDKQAGRTPPGCCFTLAKVRGRARPSFLSIFRKKNSTLRGRPKAIIKILKIETSQRNQMEKKNKTKNKNWSGRRKGPDRPSNSPSPLRIGRIVWSLDNIRKMRKIPYTSTDCWKKGERITLGILLTTAVRGERKKEKKKERK